MKYVSIDIETTGLDRERCQVLEIAAVADDLRNPKPLHELPTFRCLVVHEQIWGQVTALAMHQRIFTALRDRDPQYQHLRSEEAIAALIRFLHASTGTPAHQKVTAAGKNVASFDLPFLRAMPHESCHRLDDHLHHRSLDPGMLYFHPGIDDIIPSTETCAVRAGIWGPDEPGLRHDALDDALLVVQLLRHKLGRP